MILKKKIELPTRMKRKELTKPIITSIIEKSQKLYLNGTNDQILETKINGIKLLNLE